MSNDNSEDRKGSAPVPEEAAPEAAAATATATKQWGIMALELAIAGVCILGFWKYEGKFDSIQAIIIQIILFLALGGVCLSFVWRWHEGLKEKNPYQK